MAVLTELPKAINHAFAFRLVLLDRAGVKDADKSKDKRTCAELVTAAHALQHSNPHHMLLLSAAQVIDDFVGAVTPEP